MGTSLLWLCFCERERAKLWLEWDSNHIKVGCSLVNNIVKTTKEIIPQDIDLSYRDQATAGEGGRRGVYWWRIYFRRKVCRLLGKKCQLLFPISCFSLFPLHYSAVPELLVDQPHLTPAAPPTRNSQTMGTSLSPTVTPLSPLPVYPLKYSTILSPH